MPTINPRDRSITLTVKAKELYKKKNYPPSEDQIDANTSLLEDGGLESRFGDANKNFETNVFMNKKIIWSIALSDPDGDDKDYRVHLDYVKHTPEAGNPNFFDSENIIADPVTGKITGTISKNPNLPNKDDSYTINFIITGPQMSKEYILDPKLKISTRQEK